MRQLPQHRSIRRIGWIGCFLGCALAGAPLSAGATSLTRQNLADLIGYSELILVGQVTGLSDGFDAGVPYTEVTVAVHEAIRGKVGPTYTFRQFGLLAPRDLGNGRTYLGVSPDGWPRFAVGEDVLLFLYREASKTGLRTTVGLFQGKFKQTGHGFENAVENRGLFSDLSVSPDLLTPGERKLLGVTRGPVPADALLSLVRRAVHNRWIENGKLHHVR